MMTPRPHELPQQLVQTRRAAHRSSNPSVFRASTPKTQISGFCSWRLGNCRPSTARSPWLEVPLDVGSAPPWRLSGDSADPPQTPPKFFVQPETAAVGASSSDGRLTQSYIAAHFSSLTQPPSQIRGVGRCRSGAGDEVGGRPARRGSHPRARKASFVRQIARVIACRQGGVAGGSGGGSGCFFGTVRTLGWASCGDRGVWGDRL